jgi:uncharacterized repeat protein (TIGR03837 family)
MGLRRLKRWDIYCSAIDNYGDVGVAWRLARQLATEHAVAVRLYVDDRARLTRLAPDGVYGVEVRDWLGAQGAFALDRADVPADVVIEAFGCGLPPALLDAMEAAAVQPVWINLEYLSAEPWVDEHHALASRQPQRALTRHFYFPGFTPASGGLLRERALLARRDAFLAEPLARLALWQSLAVAPPDPGALLVSMFTYANAALPPLFDAWAAGDRAIACFIPEGVGHVGIRTWAGTELARPGDVLRRGRLVLSRARFVPQHDYDCLLWACDINFVRGEDSFVRAQWAGRPLVWHAYPQAEGAHRAKLEAFLARYGAALAPSAAAAQLDFAIAWNGDRPGAAAPTATQAWPALLGALPALQVRAQAWARELADMPDLAARLAEFAGKVLQF